MNCFVVRTIHIHTDKSST